MKIQNLVDDNDSDRWQRIVQVLPAGIVILDGKGTVKDCNPAAEALLGEPLQGRSWREIVEHLVAPRWNDGHDVSLRNGRCVNIDTQALNGEPGQVLLIKDVTHNHQLHEQLDRYRRLSVQGEMAAELAHQIRTPLATAMLHLSNSCGLGGSEPTEPAAIDKALSSLRHLEQLLDDMLFFARGGHFNVQECVVCDLLGSVVEEFAGSGHEFAIEILNRIPTAVIRANHEAMVSVLSNLVNNASQACGGDGRLLIRVDSKVDQILTIRFEDNGTGVNKELKNSIFDPFVSTRNQGTGLGLSIARAVVEAHGGSITVEDNVPTGAIFVIELPLIEPEKTNFEKPNENQLEATYGVGGRGRSFSARGAL